MNSSTLLNYARFRDDDEGDYGRTRDNSKYGSCSATTQDQPNSLLDQKHLVRSLA